MALSLDEPPRELAAAPVRPLEGVHVLLVDDEEEITDLYAGPLRAAGALVHATFDGAAALEALAGGSFDVVVSDLDMPHVDGLEMIRRIRASEALAPVPAMAITGSTRDAAPRVALDAGFDAFLPKPLGAHALVAALVALLHARPPAP